MSLEDFVPPAPPLLEPWITRLTSVAGPVVDLTGLRLPQLAEPELVEDDTALAVATESLHPGRLNRLCLEASYLRRIEGKSEREIRAYLWRRTALEEPLGDVAPGKDRSARRIVDAGDHLWAKLGAWPFAVFGGDLPSGWHRSWRVDPRTPPALYDWFLKGRRRRT